LLNYHKEERKKDENNSDNENHKDTDANMSEGNKKGDNLSSFNIRKLGNLPDFLTKGTFKTFVE
jgi:hypothetical protein